MFMCSFNLYCPANYQSILPTRKKKNSLFYSRFASFTLLSLSPSITLYHVLFHSNILIFGKPSWTPANKCLGYNPKQSDGKVPVTLELCGMLGTPSLPSLPGPP